MPLQKFAFLKRAEGEVISDESLIPHLRQFFSLGRQHTPAFSFDDNNIFTYTNLIRWALADPSCKAIDPETGEVIPAVLNKGAYICGKTGTGKSLALDILRLFVRNCRGCGCVFNGEYKELGWPNLRADEIIDRFCEGDPMSHLKKQTMLGIQDLGSEPTEAIYMGNRQELLRLILESRADYSTITFVTSNLPMLSADLRNKYGDRVQSRCREMFNYYVLGGEDRRMRKAIG